MNKIGVTRRSVLRVLPVAAVAMPSVVAAQTPRRIRIGQIGTKHAHAAGKLETILKYPDVFEFVGVVEPDPQRRSSVANKVSI